MTQGAIGWAQSWSRRQFLARGGAALRALTLGRLAHAPGALADAPAALTAEELSVLGALGSAILIASAQLHNSPGGGGYGGNQNAGGGPGVVVPPPQAIADSGLQSPQEIAAGFGSLDPDSRAYIAGLLDAIDSAPSSGGNATTAPSSRTFTSLTDAERQAFITNTLAPLAPPPATSDEAAGLQAFYQAIDALSKQIVAQIPSGTQNPTAPPTGTQTVPQPTQSGPPPAQTGTETVPVPQTVPSPPTGRQTVPQPGQTGTETVPFAQTAPPSQQPASQASTSTVLAETLLAGLQLVAIPPPPPPPELPPAPPPAPPQVIDNLFALLNAGVAPEDLPQSLIDQLTAGLGSDVEPVPPPLPPPVFGDALAVWIHGA